MIGKSRKPNSQKHYNSYPNSMLSIGVKSLLRMVEVWDISFEKNHASEKVRGLTSYAYYPELFIINSEFCQ